MRSSARARAALVVLSLALGACVEQPTGPLAAPDAEASASAATPGLAGIPSR
jgi:predicted small lipoprotein YifL